jgi:hypothetical protein
LSIQLSALAYLHAWETQQPIDDGLAFESLLRRCQLDYSVASLTRIDAFLDIVRLTHKPRKDRFLVDQANQNLLYLLAFYTGEVIGRSRRVAPSWHSYDQIVALDPAKRIVGAGFYSSACCRFLDPAPASLDFFMPLNALMGRLFDADGGKGIRSSAAPLIPQQYQEAPRTAQPLPPVRLVQPAGSNIDRAQHMAALTPAQCQQLRMTPPDRLETDKLHYLFDHEQELLGSAGNTVQTVSMPAPAARGTSGARRSELEKQDPATLYEQGRACFHGKGAAQDYGRAHDAWERAAQSGHARSLNKLGTLYEKGLGVAIDQHTALRYYHQAAEKDSGGAGLVAQASLNCS